MIEKFLKQRDKVVEDIKNKKDLYRYFLTGNLIVIVCSAIYGIGLGFFVGGVWVLFDAIKIPLLLLLTVYISLPVFYIVDVYSGGKIDFFQATVLLLIAFSIMAINLSAFMPVALLFALTTTNVHFIVLLNTCICGFAGLCGLFYLFRCFQTYYTNKNWYPAMFIGSFVAVFVGTQVAWCLRPYFHYFENFIEPIKSNFYVEVAKVAAAEPLVTVILIIIFGIVTALILATFIPKKVAKPKKAKPPTPPAPPVPLPPTYTYPYAPTPPPETEQKSETKK